MKVHKGLVAAALGSILLAATGSYAMSWDGESRGAEGQEQAARAEIRRGEAMEQEGYRLERAGEFRRGQALERSGENMERHGRRLLAQAERREHDWR